LHIKDLIPIDSLTNLNKIDSSKQNWYSYNPLEDNLGKIIQNKLKYINGFAAIATIEQVELLIK